MTTNSAQAQKKILRTEEGRDPPQDGLHHSLQGVLICDYFGEFAISQSDRLPQILAPICNLPLLHHSLEFLTRQGLSEIFVVASTSYDAVEDYLKNSQWSSWETPRISLKSVFGAKDLAECFQAILKQGFIEQDFIFCHGGVISNIDLYPYIQQHRSLKDKTIMATILFRKDASIYSNTQSFIQSSYIATIETPNVSTPITLAQSPVSCSSLSSNSNRQQQIQELRINKGIKKVTNAIIGYNQKTNELHVAEWINKVDINVKQRHQRSMINIKDDECFNSSTKSSNNMILRSDLAPLWISICQKDFPMQFREQVNVKSMEDFLDNFLDFPSGNKIIIRVVGEESISTDINEQSKEGTKTITKTKQHNIQKKKSHNNDYCIRVSSLDDMMIASRDILGLWVHPLVPCRQSSRLISPLNLYLALIQSPEKRIQNIENEESDIKQLNQTKKSGGFQSSLQQSFKYLTTIKDLQQQQLNEIQKTDSQSLLKGNSFSRYGLLQSQHLTKNRPTSQTYSGIGSISVTKITKPNPSQPTPQAPLITQQINSSNLSHSITNNNQQQQNLSSSSEIIYVSPFKSSQQSSFDSPTPMNEQMQQSQLPSSTSNTSLHNLGSTSPFDPFHQQSPGQSPTIISSPSFNQHLSQHLSPFNIYPSSLIPSQSQNYLQNSAQLINITTNTVVPSQLPTKLKSYSQLLQQYGNSYSDQIPINNSNTLIQNQQKLQNNLLVQSSIEDFQGQEAYDDITQHHEQSFADYISISNSSVISMHKVYIHRYGLFIIEFQLNFSCVIYFIYFQQYPPSIILNDCISPSNSRIGRRCMIGPFSSIDENSEVVETTLGTNCILGKGVILVGCQLWNNVTIEDNTFAIGSVFCSYSHIGKGAIIKQGCIIDHHIIVSPGAQLSENTKLSQSLKPNSSQLSEQQDKNGIQQQKQSQNDSLEKENEDEISSEGEWEDDNKDNKNKEIKSKKNKNDQNKESSQLKDDNSDNDWEDDEDQLISKNKKIENQEKKHTIIDSQKKMDDSTLIIKNEDKNFDEFDQNENGKDDFENEQMTIKDQLNTIISGIYEHALETGKESSQVLTEIRSYLRSDGIAMIDGIACLLYSMIKQAVIVYKEVDEEEINNTTDKQSKNVKSKVDYNETPLSSKTLEFLRSSHNYLRSQRFFIHQFDDSLNEFEGNQAISESLNGNEDEFGDLFWNWGSVLRDQKMNEDDQFDIIYKLSRFIEDIREQEEFDEYIIYLSILPLILKCLIEFSIIEVKTFQQWIEDNKSHIEQSSDEEEDTQGIEEQLLCLKILEDEAKNGIIKKRNINKQKQSDKPVLKLQEKQKESIQQNFNIKNINKDKDKDDDNNGAVDEDEDEDEDDWD